jgi:hypothetical protein
MTGASATEYTRELGRAFARATAAARARESVIEIAGHRIRLEFAGPALEPRVLPALDHLPRGGPGAADLTVRLFDTASTGVEPPPWPGKDGNAIARGEIRHDLGEHVEMAFSVASGTFHYLDAREDVAFLWVRRPERIPPWERAAPLRPILGWWAERRGGQLAHGAAVAAGGRGLLLAARGGSGKSSLALACLEAGMGYLGDDYVLLTHEPLEVRSLYCTAKLAPDHLEATLPGLAARAPTDPHAEKDKALLFLAASHGDRLAAGAPLSAIAVPYVAPDGRTDLRRASAVEVLVALAPSSIFQLPGAGPRALDALGEVVRRVPGYVLGLGRDVAENVDAVRRVLVGEAADAG